MIAIGTARAVAGEKIKGYLVVGSDGGGLPIRLLVLVIVGGAPGPTV